ncbi:MAG: hypothetical protein UX07_C0002G0014 [Parcubacteria group bacterium GW2011_GWA2_45_30]|nr:MAG: hypothetical protein UX07_C0002G0014 [Parcubacteria group bacterium GW2011_GWA2_45_30]
MVSMAKFGLPNSIRKFLRREKARIRRDSLDSIGAEKKISELVSEIMKRRQKEA